MFRSIAKSQRLAAVFLLGMLLFNYPLLAVFNSTAEVVGVPLLYAYIFFCWTLLIAVMALVIERSR